MIPRRPLLAGLLLAPALVPALVPVGRAAAAAPEEGFRAGLAALEAQHGGRLGVAMLDGASGRLLAYRGEERFPMCSTFKAIAAARVLARVDRGEESLDRRIVYSKDDLVTYSPATAPQAGAAGMTMDAICEAAVTLSDNTAGNLMLDSFGGPAGLTAWLREVGDPVTRLDRRETELNEAIPGDPRDTTTPAAMAGLLRTLLLGEALAPASRARLTDWLVGCRTGDARLRAGLPAGWRVGDKTGSGGDRATNDVAIVWPPGRAPVLVAAYYVGSPATEAVRNTVLAAVGKLVALAL